MQSELSDYWESGRRHVDSELDTIPFPGSNAGPWDSTSCHRAKWIDDPQRTPAYAPPSSGATVDERNPAALVREWTRKQLQSYIVRRAAIYSSSLMQQDSFSALHNFHERHGRGRAAEFGDQVWRAVGLSDDVATTVTVRWPVTAMTMRKRA